MAINIFAINLDRSVERWDRLSQHAFDLGLDIIRVPGVDGKEVAENDRVGLDELQFRRCNGRIVLAGEYGCYQSHLRALQKFLESGASHAIVVEDDIVLVPNLPERTLAAFETRPDMDVLRLFNHRTVGFRQKAVSYFGDRIGRALHGPQGSAACYAVSRSGAEKLLDRLSIMQFPWDVALERGWATGLEIYSFAKDPVWAIEGDTTIASRDAYRATKFPAWRRINTYGLRLLDGIQRFFYSLAG